MPALVESVTKLHSPLSFTDNTYRKGTRSLCERLTHYESHSSNIPHNNDFKLLMPAAFFKAWYWPCGWMFKYLGWPCPATFIFCFRDTNRETFGFLRPETSVLATRISGRSELKVRNLM